MTPFQALYGYASSSLNIGPYLDSTNEEVKDLIHIRQQIIELVKENLRKAQSRMKFFANKNRQERVFEVGDLVFLKL